MNCYRFFFIYLFNSLIPVSLDSSRLVPGGWSGGGLEEVVEVGVVVGVVDDEEGWM